MEYCRMLVVTSCKTGFMDSPFVASFFKSQFGYTPPSRKHLMTTLLDHLYADTKKKVEAKCNFTDTDSLCTLSMDAWESPTHHHIRNYMLVFDDITFYHSATDAGTTRPTGINIGTEAVAVIRDIGADNIAAVATDNAAAETTSWDTIRAAFDHIQTIGCTTHGGALLFKDVCKHAWSKKLIEKAELLAKFIRNHQFTSADLERRTTAAFGIKLKIILHGATRFAGVYYCLKRLLLLRSVIREMLVSADFEERNIDGADQAVAVANAADFWKGIGKLRKFLKPLKCLIKLHDHDCHTTHSMYPAMYKLEEMWTANAAGVPPAFKSNALKEHKTRWAWMTFDIHR